MIACLRLTMGSGSAIAGTSLSIPVSFSQGTLGVAAVQFDVPLPSGLSFASASAGSAATNAGKSVATNVNAGVLRVIVSGLNQSTIGNGNLAFLTFAIDAASPSGAVALNLTGMVASDPNGNAVVLDTPVNGSILITANQAPVVSISPNQTITLPETANVSATATDDGAPNPPGTLTYRWEDITQ